MNSSKKSTDVKIFNLKLKMTGSKLAENLPSELASIYDSINRLSFKETPDYQSIKANLQKVLAENLHLPNLKNTILKSELVQTFYKRKRDLLTTVIVSDLRTSILSTESPKEKIQRKKKTLSNFKVFTDFNPSVFRNKTQKKASTLSSTPKYQITCGNFFFCISLCFFSNQV